MAMTSLTTRFALPALTSLAASTRTRGPASSVVHCGQRHVVPDAHAGGSRKQPRHERRKPVAEQDDGQELAELTVRACEYCGGPIPKRRKDARFCSTSHRVMAHRKAKREREIHASLVTRGLTDQSLAELHAQAGPPQHWADIEAGRVDPDLLEYSDHDFGLDDDDEQTARFHALVEEDAERKPRTRGRWKTDSGRPLPAC